MSAETQDYLVFLVIAVALVLIDGQVLRVSGRTYLRQAYGDSEVAGSVSRLVTLLFHFLVLGLIGLVSTVDIDAGTRVESMVAKLGLVLLILGLAHWITLAVYGRLRNRQLARRTGVPDPDDFVAETENRAQYVARQQEVARQQLAKQDDIARHQAAAARAEPPPEPPAGRT